MSRTNPVAVLELAPDLTGQALEQVTIIEEVFSADENSDVALPNLNISVPSVDKRLKGKYAQMDANLAALDANIEQTLGSYTQSLADYKTEAKQAIDTLVDEAIPAIETAVHTKVDTMLTHLTEDADDIIINIDERMIAIEQSAGNIKTTLENKVVDAETRVRALETSNANTLAQQATQVDALEDKVNTAISSTDAQVQTKLIDVQQQVDTKFAKLDTDLKEVLVGNSAASADRLSTAVAIHGVDFDGSQGIDIPEFSSEKSGVVPKRTSNRTDTFLGEDGTWKNPTANITAMIGNANGLATLDDAGKIPSEQLPSYVDDVLEFPQATDFPNPGETGKIYIDIETNTTHRWTGSAYVKITSGEVTSVSGRRGVVTLTKDDVDLSNVDNTSDADKPISAATQAALDSKPSKAVATDTIDGLMASADKGKLDGIEEGANKYVHPTLDGYLHVPATGTTNANKVLTAGVTEGSISWVSLSKSSVGLNNVDNTADADKSVKHATTAGSLATAVNIQGVSFDGKNSIELPIFANLVDGLVPKREGSTTTKFLREDGSWVIPTNTTYTAMTSADAISGTATTANLITPAILKEAITSHAPTPTNISGNAGTATKLATPRKINNVEFDGTSDITITDSTKLPTIGGTLTGHLYLYNMTDEMRIYLGAGYYNYGTPYEWGVLKDNAYNIKLNADGFTCSGPITSAGNITAYSDIRVKDNISYVSEAINKVSSLNGVTFTRKDLKDKDRKYVGLIAQDVQKVLPEAVFEQANGKLSVDYMGLVGLLVEAIKDLNKRIELLEDK